MMHSSVLPKISADTAKIKDLALNTTVQELQDLVQTKQITPQDAMLARMYQQRVIQNQQASQKPTTTVYQDLMNPQPQPAPGGQPPESQGVMGAPSAPPPSNGMAALPSGLDNMGMAGGGIVAFADGGETDDYAHGGAVGFADRGYVDPELFKSVIAAESRNNPNAISPKGARGLAQLMPGTARDPGYGVAGARDNSPQENVRVGNDYLNAMLKKYGNMDHALAAYNWGPGNVDKWLARGAKLEELPKETRDYIPKVKAGMAQMQAKTPVPGRDMLSGVESLLPSAQAAEISPAVSQDTSSPIGRFISNALSGPEGARERYDAQQRNLQQQREKAAQLFELGGGGFKQQTPEERAKYEQTQKEINDLRSLPAITPPAAKPAAAKPVTMGPNSLNPNPPAAPEEKAPMGPPRPSYVDQLGNIGAETMPVPKEKSLKDVMAEHAEADKAYGVDTQKMFNDIRADYKQSQGDLKERKDKAFYSALTMWGLGFMGARKGQEFEMIGKSGQQALNMYTNSMDKINENEDKIKQRMHDLSIAENQYKVGRSDKALAEVNANKNEIKAIQLENVKLQNHALIESKKLAVDVFKNQNPALFQTLENIAADQRAKGNKNYSALDALKDYQGVAKTGEVSPDKARQEWATNPLIQGKFKNPDDYVRFITGGAKTPAPSGKVKFLGFEGQ